MPLDELRVGVVFARLLNVRVLVPAVLAIAVTGFGFYVQRAPDAAPAIALEKPAPPAVPSQGEQTLTRAAEAVRLLQAAPERGLTPAKYRVDALSAAVEQLESSDPKAPDRAERLANLDREMRKALVGFAHGAALGGSSPATVSPTWKARRPSQDFAASLDQAAGEPLSKWVDSLEPADSEYRALTRALGALRAQEEKGGWPAVPLRPLKPGIADPAVRTLRQRLTASGDLPVASASEDQSYDEHVEAAVRAFQEHHAMKGTGIADRATLVAMNVPIRERIRQLEVNLDRWRWMPDDLGARHFLVNIPAYLLMAREDGHTVRAIRVVVGKVGDETPVFSGTMDTVVFSPYWNVPDSIAEDETAPAIRQDPNYLARNQIEILRRTKSGAKIVNPDDVNWYDPVELSQLSFRQRPGAKNALGHVKFLFPNPFNVYLHDTPADNLFARTGRAFSHGCVRVEEPEALAGYVLRTDSQWTAERISTAMNAGVEKYVKLEETIPVHIVYFTTWVDDQGGLFFLPDVYGYDARQLKSLK